MTREILRKATGAYLLLSCGAALFPLRSDGQAPAAPTSASEQLPSVVVTGQAPEPQKTELSDNPATNPASVTVVTYPEEEKRNVRTYGDLFRPLTGISVDNFGQGGVGYGIALRGFADGDHGRDIAYFIDGVPINSPSSLHINGYSDLNPLIPELVDRVELTRGPFDVRFGSFALGGALNITTLDQPKSGIEATGGSFDTGRGLGVYTFNSGNVSVFGSLLGSTTPGYRGNQDLHQINTFDKISLPMLDGIGSVRFQIYSNDYGAPGYIDRDLVRSGALNPRSVVNSTDGGSTSQQNIVFNYRQSNDEPFTANVYLLNDDFKRFSTFDLVPTDADQPGKLCSLTAG